MATLEIRNINKTYQASEGKVLDGIDLTVKDGDLAFLLGPSGCGKSTLLRILAGLVEADEGEILLDGKSILDLPPEKRNMPMVFQNYALWPHMDVFDNIAFGLKILKMSKKEITQRVEEMLALVQMEKFIHRKIPSLSGGQQQRIALARALASDPAVLLLDEPLSNLDAKLRDTMRFEIRRICKSRGITAVYVTHDRKEALSMADSVSIFEKGKLSQTGTPREVYLRPKNRFTASFLGDVNFIRGTFEGTDGNALAKFRTNTGLLLVKDPAFLPEQGQECLLSFRPEAALCDTAQNINQLDVTLLQSTFLGESTFRKVSCSGMEFFINEYSGKERADGSSISLVIPPERIALLED